MSVHPSELAALLGSRICHDLINPIGAISNGLELMALSGAGEGAEQQLITQSVANAQARIQFYRVAYGTSDRGRGLSVTEIRQTLTAIYDGSRFEVSWNIDQDVPRDQAKLAFLLLQCLETAMPVGGRIDVDLVGERWVLVAGMRKIRDLGALWDTLRDGAQPDAPKAEMVQFALAPLQAQFVGTDITVEIGETSITLGF